MPRLLGIILAAGLLLLASACATGPNIPGHEPYRGPLAAGVVRPPGPDGARVQRQLIASLEETGRFAGAFPLWSAQQNTEAEVIVEPAIIRTRSGPRGLAEVELRVSAFRKPARAQAFSKTYRDRASGNRDALEKVAAAVSRDLERRFGARPVY